MRVAVFASGRGSNFQAILDASARGELEADVVLCVSDREEALALERARSRGIHAVVVHPSMFESEETYASAILRQLTDLHVDLIALAGYMRKIPQQLVEAFRGNILNVHPALLPAFGGKGMYGKRVHQAVVEYGVHWTGATVHLVEEEYDTGPIVLQQPVPVYPDDSPDDVAARVLEVEHRIYPDAIRLFAQGRVQLEGRRVRILASEPAELRTS